MAGGAGPQCLQAYIGGRAAQCRQQPRLRARIDVPGQAADQLGMEFGEVGG